MYAPAHDGPGRYYGWTFVLEGSEAAFYPHRHGLHVLPAALMDLLPQWPLASNRPQGWTEEQGMEPHSPGSVMRLYMIEEEALAALDVAVKRIQE